jgi:ABC-type transport system involved in multi-copper enzyme maturation permease subunit
MSNGQDNPPPPAVSRRKRARGWWPLLGPLFHYDLVNSTRRGQHNLLRCLTAIVLLITLLVGYSSYVNGFDALHPFAESPLMNPREQENFANWFMIACLTVQMVGMFFVAPGVIADTIAREKENRTLEFLFVTELSDWEIIAGKLFSRLAYLVGVLLAALPILALTQLFGGVDIEHIGFGYAMLLSSLFVVGATSMFSSVTATSVVGATVAAYAAAFGYGVLCVCCLTGALSQGANWTATLIVTGVNVFLGLVVVSASIHELRPRAKRVGPQMPVVRRPVRRVVRAPVPVAPVPIPHRAPLPRTDTFDRLRRSLPAVYEDWPLLWKETCQHASAWRLPAIRPALLAAVIVPLIFASIMFLLLSMTTVSGFGGADQPLRLLGEFGRVIVSVLTVMLAGLIALIALRHATGSVTREREKNTLSALLTLPVEREKILEAKWLGGFVGWSPVLITMLGVLVFGIVTGGISIPRVFVLVCAIAGPLEFLASLGLWLSITCRTSMRANLAAVLCLLLMVALPVIVANYIELSAPGYNRFGNRASEYILTGGLPPVAWVRAIVGGDQPPDEAYAELRAILWGALAYSAGAWVLWRDARVRFRRMSR